MYEIAMTMSPTEVHHDHHLSESWSGGRAISCDVAGRSELLRTRSRNLQIEILISESLEDDTCFAITEVSRRHLLQEIVSNINLQLELAVFAGDTTEGEVMHGELAIL